MPIRLIILLLCLGTVFCFAQEPPRIRLAPLLTGLELPVAFVDDGSGRHFVVEQDGTIRVVRQGQVQSQPFLDICDRVSRRGNECGLLGLAFHPQYKANGRFFVNYTTVRSGKLETSISEFHAPPAARTADPRSEKIIMRFDQPWDNHNGGGIEFGPDGMLYIGNGDGGAGGDPHNAGQRLDTWLGKMLRIDVDKAAPYSVPPDNPFVGRKEALPEIWAWGLRNPWRFSFDRKTGELYAGDVGQNKWEEISIIEKGGNYGWSAREGMHDFKPQRKAGELIEPIKEYERRLGQSVTGGYVYRGKEMPQLNGVYIYADYQSGRIWGLKWENGRLTMDAELMKAPMLISSFGEDRAGELYVCDHHGGRIWRITQ